MVRLRAMTADEFQAFLDWSVPEYARDHVQSGRWKESEAVERSRAEHAGLLPQGVNTPNNFLRTISDESGSRVGEVWFALQKDGDSSQVFVYWIGINEPYRRKGYATEVFHILEAEAKRLGASRVALHVFGGNQAGRALYEGLGYAVTNIIMTKPV